MNLGFTEIKLTPLLWIPHLLELTVTYQPFMLKTLMYLLGKQISSTIEDREEPAPAQL